MSFLQLVELVESDKHPSPSSDQDADQYIDRHLDQGKDQGEDQKLLLDQEQETDPDQIFTSPNQYEFLRIICLDSN